MALDGKYQGTTTDNMFFTESGVSEPHKVVRKIKVKSNRMNSNLNELKRKMAREAKRVHADAIVHFKYGQKRSIMSPWDSTKWYAEGEAIRLRDESEQ